MISCAIARLDDDAVYNLARLRNSRYELFPLSAASQCAGNVYAEADAEDGGLGLLRREGGAGVARQVGRYGGNSDADYEQPEAAGGCGLAAGAGRAIASRHHRSGERQRSWRAHSLAPAFQPRRGNWRWCP